MGKWSRIIYLISLMVWVIPARAQLFADSGGGDGGAAAASIAEEVRRIAQYIKTAAAYSAIDVDVPLTTPPPVPNLNQLTSLLKALAVFENNSTLIKMQFQPNNSIDQGNARNLTFQIIENVLTTAGAKDDCVTSNCKTAPDIQSHMANNFGFSNPYKAAQIPNGSDKAMSIDALLGSLTYKDGDSNLYGIPSGTKNGNKSERDQAALFIKLSAGLANPPALFSRKNFFNVEKKTQNEYLNMIYQYAASLSVGVSNFAQMYARRVKQENGKSLLQAEYELAKRRTEQSWHNEMEKQTPQVIQREILYTLAEMNYQMYQARLAQERLIATVSSLQLQLAQTGAAGITREDDE